MGGCEGSLGAAVYADGGICLDILQNQWSPIYDVSAILTSIRVRTLPTYLFSPAINCSDRACVKYSSQVLASYLRLGLILDDVIDEMAVCEAAFFEGDDEIKFANCRIDPEF